ncbi:MAG TPA: DUF2007 domain-containing protein [Bacteroidales bacterium]|jgi:rubredoxin|nr:DUF2007 domain-containing protein [Bacteroidales bacterium]
MATVILMTCNTIAEAHLVKGMLENHGISSFINNENFSNLMPQFNGMMGAGVQVVVDEADYKQAIELAGLKSENNELTCPECHSANIGFGLGTRKAGKIMTIFFSLLSGTPFGNIRNNYYCKDCGAEFKR